VFASKVGEIGLVTEIDFDLYLLLLLYETTVQLEVLDDDFTLGARLGPFPPEAETMIKET
jgi:hypothetical protein